MKRVLVIVFSALLVLSMVAYSSDAVEVLTGSAKGFIGEVTVTVTKQGDKIVKVEAVGDKETQGIGTRALDQLPQAIVDANSTDVDLVAGASVTSRAIIYAVNNALNPEKYPAPADEADKAPASVSAAKVYQGFGLVNSGRMGPGKDDTGTQVYSINQVFAHVLFDDAGTILAINVDQLEVATPNYDGNGMPHLSGFPGQGGYNFDVNHDEKIDGKTLDTVENFMAEVRSWATKRGRGETYHMGSFGNWSNQMNKFEELFVGKTAAEVEEWFNKYTSDVNGRPLKAGSSRDEDKAKYEALSASEKEMLADVTSGATMSLNDAHGNIIAAISSAYENRVGLDIESAAAYGFGLSCVPRVGPGKDDTGTPVYSINEVYANTLFDEDGKIVAIYVDQLEVATPNYDGEGMPHFSGFPGQGGYNYDADHDEKVDYKTLDSDENFLAEVASWVTKRDRGETYHMGSFGTWSNQMDKFEELFIGKTAAEVEEWFNKYTSDVNGRPLKAGSSRDEDKAKYEALSAGEKDMLADVTSGATMSLNDAHGDIIAAIVNSFENAIDIELTVK